MRIYSQLLEEETIYTRLLSSHLTSVGYWTLDSLSFRSTDKGNTFSISFRILLIVLRWLLRLGLEVGVIRVGFLNINFMKDS